MVKAVRLHWCSRHPPNRPAYVAAVNPYQGGDRAAWALSPLRRKASGRLHVFSAADTPRHCFISDPAWRTAFPISTAGTGINPHNRRVRCPRSSSISFLRGRPSTGVLPEPVSHATSQKPSDSRCWLGRRPASDAETLFNRPSGARCGFGREQADVPRDGGAFQRERGERGEWPQRQRASGSAAARRMGHQPGRALAAERDWLLGRVSPRRARHLAELDGGAGGARGGVLAGLDLAGASRTGYSFKKTVFPSEQERPGAGRGGSRQARSPAPRLRG